MKKACSVFLIFAALLVAGPSTARLDQSAAHQASSAQIESPNLRIEFDNKMRSRVVARFGGKDVSVGAFSASETVKGKQQSWNDFVLSSQTRERVTDTYGKGEKLSLTGLSGTLRKNLSVIIYDEFPNLAVFDVSYTNVGKSQVTIIGWNNNTYTIDAQRATSNVPFWSFQSGSYERRPDWVVPLHTGFSNEIIWE
jgi:alpha-galactosidase